jgi:type VI secretion system protein
MHHALFEILVGQYAGGRVIAAAPNTADVLLSIKDHLTRLLNARQGSLAHMPDYGLPDIGLIYQGLPYSVTDLAEALKRAILRYEPRLRQVQVTHRPIEVGKCVLQLDVTGTLVNGERVAFETYFLSGGYAEVRTGRRKG